MRYAMFFPHSSGTPDPASEFDVGHERQPWSWTPVFQSTAASSLLARCWQGRQPFDLLAATPSSAKTDIHACLLHHWRHCRLAHQHRNRYYCFDLSLWFWGELSTATPLLARPMLCWAEPTSAGPLQRSVTWETTYADASSYPNEDPDRTGIRRVIYQRLDVDNRV
jgi:hypothetical protein